MAEHKYKATCHTKCYWLENLWQPGEVYEGDIEPIKHFSADGKVDPDLPPPDAGSDPRSNQTIRKILKNKYQSTKPKNWSRKKLWAALQEFETAEAMDASTGEEGNDFLALCGAVCKSKAGAKAHERNCDVCQKLMVQ